MRVRQFHPNSVLRRPVPSSYLVGVKTAQVAHGKIDPTGCPDSPMAGVTRINGEFRTVQCSFERFRAAELRSERL